MFETFENNGEQTNTLREMMARVALKICSALSDALRSVAFVYRKKHNGPYPGIYCALRVLCKDSVIDGS